jgi:hypothetical protein
MTASSDDVPPTTRAAPAPDIGARGDSTRGQQGPTGADTAAWAVRDAIREIADGIWEREGRPAGRDAAIWLAARRALGLTDDRADGRGALAARAVAQSVRADGLEGPVQPEPAPRPRARARTP